MDGHYRGSHLGSLALCSLALLDDSLSLLFVEYLGLLGQREKEECFSVLVSMEVLVDCWVLELKWRGHESA